MLSCMEFAKFDALNSSMLIMCLAGLVVTIRASREFFFGRSSFIIAFVAMFYWLVVKYFEVSTSDWRCGVFWSQMAWPAIILQPTAWAFFLSDYAAGQHRPLKELRLVMLTIVPAFATMAALTNDWHLGIYGPNTGPVASGAGTKTYYEHGWLFYAFVAYVYVILARSVFVTLRALIKGKAAHRLFYGSLLGMTLLPIAANLGYILCGFTINGHDPTPMTFIFSTGLFVVQFLRAGLKDIDVIAKELLYRNSPNPIIVIDLEGRVLTYNNEALRIFNFEGELQQNISVLNRELAAFVNETVKTKGRPVLRTLIVRRRFFDPEIIPLHHETGPHSNLIGWVIRFEDSTERRFLSDALQAERDFLSRLMETSMSGILALDAHGHVMFINAESERILGLEGTNIDRLRLDDPDWAYESIDGLPVAGMAHVVNELIENNLSIRNRRISLLRRNDGQRRIISVNATVLISPDADTKVVVSLGDVTDQHYTEQRLREAAAKSEAANRSKSQFIANMSHEIRTPLNGVLGMAEVLERLIKDPEQHRMLSTIQRSGELLLTILNDVLDMSKIEAGKLELEAILFRPDQLAGRIEELYQVAADEKQLELEVFTSGRADLPRVGDPHRIMQIMQNLVSNAIKFTREGEISVIFSCPIGKPLVIEVRDSGIGMTGEQVTRMFRAFEQADGSTTRRFGGTGLGMAIVEKLVELMNGSIEVESGLGEGTMIRVTLPLEEG